MSVQQRLLWNYLILLPAIDRYRRSDGAVASFSTSTSICVEPIWDFGEGGVLAWIAQHLHQFTFFGHLLSCQAC